MWPISYKMYILSGLCGSKHIWLKHEWYFSQSQRSFSKLKLFCLLLVEASLVWSLSPFDMTLVVFNSFLTVWHDRLICTVCASDQNQSFLQEALVSFSAKWHFKTTIWPLIVFAATGLATVSRSLQWTERGYI